MLQSSTDFFMIDSIVAWLQQMSYSVSLPTYALVGGLLEELIAPIPSPLVNTLAGSIAASKGLGYLSLLWICVLSSAAKSVGAWPFFIIPKKLEKYAVSHFGKYLGVRQADVDALVSRFRGTWKDMVLVTFLRSIPVMPSSPISVACGVVQMRNRVFFITTFTGFYVRNMIFMLIGYLGLNTMESVMSGLDTAETVLKVLVIALLIGGLGYLYWRRARGQLLEK